jgi:hypothetical protein
MRDHLDILAGSDHPDRPASTVGTQASHSKTARACDYNWTVHPFRAALEAGDWERALALLDEDVVFRSPVVFTPYHGREAIGTILRAVAQILEDFRFMREIGAEGGADHALVFRARIGDREIEGSDFLHTNEKGMIDEFTVMVRPLSAALALAKAMGERLANHQGGAAL